MTTYCIMKSTRVNLNDPHPYSGPSCAMANIEPGKVYENLEEAEADALKMSECNPVGFKAIPYKNRK